MRSTAIMVYNNRKSEVFVEKRKDGFELWTAGLVKGCSMLLDHHLTHDDLEAHLEYAEPGDLVWRDADSLEIPTDKHRNAVQYEDTIKRGTFLDYEGRGPECAFRSVADHLGSIGFITPDRRETNAAKKALLGEWTDGVVTVGLRPNNKLEWSCTDRDHRLNWEFREHAPDWWSFAAWRIGLMNTERRFGTHVAVLRVSEYELHLSGLQPHRLAHIFRRIDRPLAETPARRSSKREEKTGPWNTLDRDRKPKSIRRESSMNTLPHSENPLVIRIDFSDDAAWFVVRSVITAPEEDFGFEANVEFVDDRQYERLTIKQLLKLTSGTSYHTFVFLVDHMTLTHPEHPVIIVDLSKKRGRSFRVIPSAMWMVENNLSIANADWEDFADKVDEDGVYRGLSGEL